MKRMLFNASQPEESRVAIVDGQKLINLDIETYEKEQRRGNIYKAVITKVEPSLEACFVDYGSERNGFLPFKEIHRSYFKNYSGGRAKIQEVVDEGDSLLVQVEKDERGSKGATLTTHISLAGRYLVLMPNNSRGGGVSRRIEGEDRLEIRKLISELQIPEGMSVIVRTAGVGRALEELQWDLNYQLKLWQAVKEAAAQENVQHLILQERDLVIRSIRDYFQPDIGEILIDNPEVYEKVYQFISFVLPESVHKVKLYKEHIPLFSRFQIENQIDSVYARSVSLPSGGEIVIDHTEALVSVDVNSAKATRGADVEETALQTNLEAVEEVAKQMRLRDIGGLIVIDFIDMDDSKNQRDIENAMREAVKEDRARIQLTRLSRFGLMEISRQRLQISLGESTHMTCPRCSGTGVIRGVQSSAIHTLRVIQEKALKENTGEIQAQVPIEVATFLLNEKREELFNLEERLGAPIVIIPNKYLEVPHYSVERIRCEEADKRGVSSYKLVDKEEEKTFITKTMKNKVVTVPEAAVQGVHPSEPAPKHIEPKKSLLKGLSSWLNRILEGSDKERSEEGKKTRPRRNNNRRSSNNNGRSRGNYRKRNDNANYRRRENDKKGFDYNEEKEIRLRDSHGMRLESDNGNSDIINERRNDEIE